VRKRERERVWKGEREREGERGREKEGGRERERERELHELAGAHQTCIQTHMRHIQTIMRHIYTDTYETHLHSTHGTPYWHRLIQTGRPKKNKNKK
jgi:hypothetical protein